MNVTHAFFAVGSSSDLPHRAQVFWRRRCSEHTSGRRCIRSETRYRHAWVSARRRAKGAVTSRFIVRSAMIPDNGGRVALGYSDRRTSVEPEGGNEIR
jgi:hypothetical protein